MSFNGSGTYVPPAGQPVAAGTVIQSSTFNTLITDIGNTFNNVLPRDGQAAMAAQLKLIDGTSSMPGIAFNSEASTGIFRPMTGTLALVASGIEIMRINNAGRVLVGTTADDGVNRLQVNGGASFAGTVTGITATMVGLANVNNTSDVNKPVSTAQQTALNLKANLTGAAFTGGLTVAASEALRLIGDGSLITAFNTANNARTGYVQFNPAGASVISIDVAQALAFNTTATERMRVSAGGNLLLGSATDNGSDKLQVTGSGRFSGKVAVGTSSYVSTSTLHVEDASNGATVVTVVAGASPFTPGIEFRRTTTLGGAKVAGARDNTNGGFALTFATAADNSAEVSGTYAEQMRITRVGNLLVGNATDVGGARMQITGPAASGATASWRNGSDGARGFGYLYSDGGGAGVCDMSSGIGNGIYWSTSSNYVSLQTVGAERARMDSNGNLLVGVASGSNHSIRRNVVAGGLILGIGPAAGESHRFYVADTGGANAAATAYALDKIGTTGGRSINAAGTINATGADYAEYMPKAANCGDIAKGQVVGITAAGEVTDLWLDAVSFMVKTTNPSYVGGDSWGSEEAIGATKPLDPAHANYAEDLAVFEAALEVARAKVDRIAYAGQVPVNVMGAKPGQYIVPGRFGDSIGGIVMNLSDMNMQQYANAVGIVQNILPDGRANVRVKVA